MAKVPNAIEILPKISTAWVGRTSVTDRRQTDDRRTGDSKTESSVYRNVNLTRSQKILCKKITSAVAIFIKSKCRRPLASVAQGTSPLLPQSAFNSSPRISYQRESVDK